MVNNGAVARREGYCPVIYHLLGGAKARSPCSVVKRTASPTAIGEAVVLISSPVGRVLIWRPSRRPSTTAAALESGVKSAPSSAVSGCADILPGSCLFQIR